MQPPSPKCLRILSFLTLVALLLFVPGHLPLSAQSAVSSPISRAWEQARGSGGYAFTSDIVQVTTPSNTLATFGRLTQQERYYLEGTTNTQSGNVVMRLWTESGSVALPSSAVEVKLEDGRTWVRQQGGDWSEVEGMVDSFAPQGDFLAYLQWVRDVEVLQPETRAGLSFTRYSFTIDSRMYATWQRDQTVTMLRARGELPVGAAIEPSEYVADMVASGELWVGRDGMPIRQMIQIDYPEKDNEAVSAHIQTNFRDFGLAIAPAQMASSTEPSTGPFTDDDSTASAWTSSANPAPQAESGLSFGPISGYRWRAATDSLLALLSILLFAIGIVRFRRSRVFHTALSAALIASIVGGPLLGSLKQAQFSDSLVAKAAASEAREQRADAIRGAQDAEVSDPHRSPLEAAAQRQRELALAAAMDAGNPDLEMPAAAPATALDPGGDEDGDGLTNEQEAMLGTSPTYADSDQDGVPDRVEVQPINLGGRQWYGDPHNNDVNRDGIVDGLEWNHLGLPPEAPNAWSLMDTDGDAIPDLYDEDNDGDNVPDSLDLSPFTRTDQTFDKSNAMQLTIAHPSGDKPTFVDFQIRPADAKQLWFAFNILDWPNDDDEGQIRDVNGGTFADLAAAQGREPTSNEGWGDMKLVPMLEIRMADAGAHLPPESDLAPFAISVRNLTANGSEKAAYVPLSVVTDQRTGQRVAFNGRMLYRPQSNWGTPHSVRLVWAVQALVDRPVPQCAVDAPAIDCSETGYQYDVLTVVQTYYEPWKLTGLNLSEEHGAKVATIFSNPQPGLDADPLDDAELVALAQGLSIQLVGATDEKVAGARDLTVDDLANRFDHDLNAALTMTETWGITRTLEVSIKDNYPTLIEAVARTAENETPSILDAYFGAARNTHPAIKPLLLYAHEQKVRAMGLDAHSLGNYATWNGGALTLDLAPAGSEPLSLDIIAGIKWTPYCTATSGDSTWAVCDGSDYWNVLEERYGPYAFLPGHTDTDQYSEGALFVIQLYFLSMMNGVSQIVLNGDQIVSTALELKKDSDYVGYARTGLNAAKGGVSFIINSSFMARFKQLSLYEYLKKEVFATPVSYARSFTSAIRNTFSGGLVDFAKGTVIIVVLGVLIAAISVLLVYYLQDQPAVGAVIAFQSFVTAVQLIISVALPTITVFSSMAASSSTVGSFLLKGSTAISASQAASAIGAAIAIAIVWGFFIYTMASQGLTAQDPAFRKALAETVTQTIWLILLFALGTSVIGAIIAIVLAFFDVVMSFVCQVIDTVQTDKTQKNALKVWDNECLTLGRYFAKALSFLFFNFGALVDLSAPDLITNGTPRFAPVEPDTLFQADKPFTVSLPVTATVTHADPHPVYGGFLIGWGMHLFTKKSIASSTFKFDLVRSPTPNRAVYPYEMTTQWTVYDRPAPQDKFNGYPMYAGHLSTLVTASEPMVLPAGLNQSVPYDLRIAMAAPAYQCQYVGIGSPWCTQQVMRHWTSNRIDAVVLDIFPNTLNGLMAADLKSDGFHLRWGENAFAGTPLPDADGDGLFRTEDPDEGSWDIDADGLSDRFEVDLRKNGVPINPRNCLTINEFLNDAQKIHYGLDVTRIDADGDDLVNAHEVFHQTWACGEPTGNWNGGWYVDVPGLPEPVLVTSDPNAVDSDGDGWSDRAEYDFAQADTLDPNGHPYLPMVQNVQPVTVFLQHNDLDGIVAPGQTIVVTSTIVANSGLYAAYNHYSLELSSPFVVQGTNDYIDYPFSGEPETVVLTHTVSVNASATVADAAITGVFDGMLTTFDEAVHAEGRVTLVVDATDPTSTIEWPTGGAYVRGGALGSPRDITLSGTALDNALVSNVMVNVNGASAQQADGRNAWSLVVPVQEASGTSNNGQYTATSRAVDAVNRTESPGATTTFYADGTAPVVTLENAPTAWQRPQQQTDGSWLASALQFRVADPNLGNSAVAGSGVDNDSVALRLAIAEGAGATLDVATSVWQTPTHLSGNGGSTQWSHSYNLGSATVPNGVYQVNVRARDNVGNNHDEAQSVAAIGLDAIAPVVLLGAQYNNLQVVTQTIAVGGVISDGVSLAGVKQASARLTPIEQVNAYSEARLYLPFDDPAGTLYFADISGNGKHASCYSFFGNNCPASNVAGVRDTGVFLSGAAGDGTLVVGTKVDFNIPASESFTLQMWVKPEKNGVVLAEKSGAYLLLLDTSGVVSMRFTGASVASLNGGVISTGQWHHLVTTLDRSVSPNRYKLYVDGILRAEQQGGAAAEPFVGSQPLYLGGAGSNNLKGTLDEVVILPLALDAPTVAALYRAGTELSAWLPVQLASSGAGVAQTAWQFQIPAEIEGTFQLDVRAEDMVGNLGVTRNLAQWVIDTAAPQVTLTATPTGARRQNASSGATTYEVRYLCSGEDLHLAQETQAALQCPQSGTTQAVRTFYRNPLLQNLYPDLTIVSRLAMTYSVWESDGAVRTATALDQMGRTGSASVTLDLESAVGASVAGATAPAAFVIAPTDNRYLPGDGVVIVTVAATSSAPLKEIQLLLDGVLVSSTTFAQNAAITTDERLVAVDVTGQGAHTLVARAIDWNGNAQAPFYPVRFYLDTQPPAVSIETATLSMAETYAPLSGMLIFAGAVSDAVCIASVQLAVDGGDFAEAGFEGGIWRTVYWVNAPEGRALNALVRATDCAGRVTETTKPIQTALSSATAPDTTISSAPPAATSATTANFAFAGVEKGSGVAGFQCKLDEGAFLSCPNPFALDSLSGGAHTLLVRAFDDDANVDATPAVHNWTVNLPALTTMIQSAPGTTTQSRQATFTFSSGASVAAHECSLDGAPFSPCASPRAIVGLDNGAHTFRVRGANAAGQRGATVVHGWTVVNAAPMAVTLQLTTLPGAPLQITLGATDANADPLVFNVTSTPQKGVLQGAGAQFTYTSDPTHEGSDSFTFGVADGHGGSASGVVQITTMAGTRYYYLPVISLNAR